MIKKKRYIGISLINFAIFSALIMLHFSGVNITISGASPIFVLPALTAFAMFYSEGRSAAVGLVIGIFMDAFSSNTYCFNTLILMLIATAVSFTSHYVFNRNIRSALAMVFIVCTFYYFIMWVCFYAIGVNASNSFLYLFRYGFPSSVYSSVFIIPFYFLEKGFYKKRGMLI